MSSECEIRNMKILTVKGSQGPLIHLASETVAALLLAKPTLRVSGPGASTCTR